MIGEDARKKQEISYSGMFSRIAFVGNLFNMAESVASADRPLLNANPRIYSIGSDELKVQAFSDVPVSDNHEMVLAVGSKETGFYQVPIIKLSGGTGKDGIDVTVSGTIDDKGTPEKFDGTKKLSDLSKELYGVGIDSARKVYAIALMPKADILGQDVLIGGRNIGPRTAVYNVIVNGFAMKGNVLGKSPFYIGGVGPMDTFAPIMYPQKDGEERFFRLGDILSQKELSLAESSEVFPGLTFVAGRFEEAFIPHYRSLMGGGRSPLGEVPVLYSLSPKSTEKTMNRGADDIGRVGLDVGSESNVKYRTVKGAITSIDGILALHFLGIGQNANPEQVKAEIERLAR